MIAVDTNVLVYAHRREPPEHPRAMQLLRELAEGSTPWAIPWPCVYEFLSVVTNSRIWREAASTTEQAWRQLDAWLAAPSVRLIAETEDFQTALAAVARSPKVRGPLVHDARIAALCLAHGVDRLLTRDRDFSAFPQLPVDDPFRG